MQESRRPASAFPAQPLSGKRERSSLGGVMARSWTLPRRARVLGTGFLKQESPQGRSRHDSDFGGRNKWKGSSPFARDPTNDNISRAPRSCRKQRPDGRRPELHRPSRTAARHVGCPVQARRPVFVKDEGKPIKYRPNGGDVLVNRQCWPAAGFICPCHGGRTTGGATASAGPPVRRARRYGVRDIVKRASDPR